MWGGLHTGARNDFLLERRYAELPEAIGAEQQGQK